VLELERVGFRVSRRRDLEVPEVGADEVRVAADLHRHRLPHLSTAAFRGMLGSREAARRNKQLLSSPQPERKNRITERAAVKFPVGGLVSERSGRPLPRLSPAEASTEVAAWGRGRLRGGAGCGAA
jgi:hypothetical protein